MNAVLPSTYTLILPADRDGAAPSTVVLPRASVVYIAFRLGQTLAEQVRGAFGALGLEALATRYAERYQVWTERLRAAGATWFGASSGAAAHCWTASLAIGDEETVAELRTAYAEVEAAWAPIQAVIVQCRGLLAREGFPAAEDPDRSGGAEILHV